MLMVCLLCNVVTVLNHQHNFDSLVDSAAIVCAKWFICIACSLFAANHVTKTRCTLSGIIMHALIVLMNISTL